MMDTLRITTSCSNPPFAHRLFLSDPAAREEALIKRAQMGVLEAFNQLVLLYQDRVYRQALWILHNEEAAEDATQETFLLAYRKLDSFRGSQFRPWLLKIATNQCLDQLRSFRRRPTQPLEAYDDQGEADGATAVRGPDETPERVLERSELVDTIIAGFQKLAMGFRLPIILVDLQELDYHEASAVMQIPIGTLKSRLARARRKLCKELRNQNLIGGINRVQ